MQSSFLTPDFGEQFPTLAKPPIVEAVIFWQALPQSRFKKPEELKELLAAAFADFPIIETMRKFRVTAQVSETNAPIVEKTDDWTGYRLRTADRKYAIQFRRDGLAFSQSGGYEHWQPFIEAAKQAWGTYQRIAEPLEVQQLSVRFINHIPAATPENVGDFLGSPPTCPENLELKEFVYQSTFAVPSLPFTARVIKVMQPSNPELQKSSGLFLDIDVLTNRTVSLDEREQNEILSQIRWVKNKVFFTLISDSALELFGGAE